ncbi:methionyl-tRNA formyltransferase [Parafilimonas terrae]|uniref:Methionyl-tRNA formyltransferase n=1 Tax=Parafilimonas terrae TaxID=1465490 RepID=A0A1I5SLX6_9BACT|nr:methionyl-tRNA formyltransferase [Parafilimonas terrae]SFP71336.1 methionyl-tRNA formyltransferase [Parafilimonas terrae]
MSTLKDLRIVFMGTPEFAVASLEALVNAGCNIVGVITAPDKPAGRGMQLQQSAVKKYAVEKSLTILQPEKLKNPVFVEQLKSLQADVQVVVAFRMLPETVWNMPPLGTINVHASLLPQYRGAAPINWAIINGETETGITTFKLQHEIDTGNILMQEKMAIGEKETAGELHDKLKELGASLIVKTINEIAKGNIKEQQQLTTHNSQLTIKHAPKLNTETCKIDWNNNASDIYNLIRGLSPYPAAFTYLNDKVLKIFSAEKETATHNFSNGSFHTDNKTYLKFACADGFIYCSDVQLQGKKRMHIEDFLRGYRFN